MTDDNQEIRLTATQRQFCQAIVDLLKPSGGLVEPSHAEIAQKLRWKVGRVREFLTAVAGEFRIEREDADKRRRHLPMAVGRRYAQLMGISLQSEDSMPPPAGNANGMEEIAASVKGVSAELGDVRRDLLDVRHLLASLLGNTPPDDADDNEEKGLAAEQLAWVLASPGEVRNRFIQAKTQLDTWGAIMSSGIKEKVEP